MSFQNPSVESMASAKEHLIYCLGTDPEASKPGMMSNWTAFDWDQLVSQSVRYGLGPYLYHRLKILRPAVAIPPSVERRLKDLYRSNASRNIRLFHELGKVLEAMKEEGVYVIALKGAHLAQLVYGNIALRPMMDVDLLVRKEKLASAARVLGRLGYAAGKPFWIESHSEKYRHLPIFTRENAVSIEIHHAIVNPGAPFGIETDQVWQDAESVRIAETDAKTLCAEDLLLYLCLHAAYQHRFSCGPRALCDIMETVRNLRDQIDTDKLARRAKKWRLDRCVYFTLLLTRDLFGDGPAVELMKVLEPNLPDPRLVAWAREQVFSLHDSTIWISPNLARTSSVNGFFNKTAHLVKSIFVPRAILANLYPVSPSSNRVYFFYFVRLKDVLFRYGRTAFRLLLRSKKVTSVAGYENYGNALEYWLTSRSMELGVR